MSFLPAVQSDLGGALTPRQAAQAAKAQGKAELAVFRHGLGARVLSECDRLDSEAVADASRSALEEELDLLDYGMSRAGQSAARMELVARHVEALSNINNRRISRRFGG